MPRTQHAIAALACSAWSDQVLRTGADIGALDYSTYAGWAAQMVGVGHDYIGTTGKALAEALLLDIKADGAVGYNFKTLAGALGGVRAEPGSHVRAAADALLRIWGNDALERVREPATGFLLERLISARTDYEQILAALYQTFKPFPAVREYMVGWMRGHFLMNPAETRVAKVIGSCVRPIDFGPFSADRAGLEMSHIAPLEKEPLSYLQAALAAKLRVRRSIWSGLIQIAPAPSEGGRNKVMCAFSA